MKYITVLITDTHFGTHNNSMTWLKSQREFFEKQFIPHIKDLKEKGYSIRVVHCGDVFDSRSTINTYIATAVVDIFSQICDVVDKFVIVGGNHDFYNPTDDSVDTISLIFNQLRTTDCLQIITKTKSMDTWGSETSLYVPWYEWLNQDGLKEWLKGQKIDKIFTHADLAREETDIKNTIITGHIHTPFFKNNILNLGSTFALTFTDCNAKRGFYEYEDGGSLHFIENEYSIRFWRFSHKEILSIPDYIKPNDYIELYATKAMLSRKNYMDACNEWFDRFKNVTTIPQIDETGESEIDIKQFEGYDIEKMTERLIPEELKDKFEQIKQYINSNKD